MVYIDTRSQSIPIFFFFFFVSYETFYFCKREKHIKTGIAGLKWTTKKTILCPFWTGTKTTEWALLFTNSQTDTDYMGERGTAAVHSRQGRDVSEWWKQAWAELCLADKTTRQWRCQDIWAQRTVVTQFCLIPICLKWWDEWFLRE